MVDITAGNTIDRSRLGQALFQNATTTSLAFITTIGFFGLIGALLYIDASVHGAAGAQPPGLFHDLLNTTVGIVGTAWATIMAFYFGSSTGSQQKTETLSQVALRAQPVHPAVAE